MIYENAFTDCSVLKEITVPASVKYIGEYAFGYCISYGEDYTKTEGFKVKYEENTEAHRYAIDNGFATGSCFVVEDYNEDYNTVFITGYAGNDKTLVIPSEINGKKVASISSYAFENGESLESVIIPSGIEYIDARAFISCHSLKSVTIPDTVTWIGSYAMGYDIDEETVDYVKVDGFKINYVKNTYGHRYAAKNGFTDESCLITTGDKVLYIKGYYSTAKEYVIPSEIDGKKVAGIDNDAFRDNINLERVTIPEGIGYISTRAFYNCTALKSVTIPKSVESIGEEAFCNCTALTSVTIPEGVVFIEQGTFYNCTALKSVAIPRSAEDIGDMAFGYYYDEKTADYEAKTEGFTINYIKNTGGHVYAVTNGFADVEEELIAKELSDGTLEISLYFGQNKEFVIPSQIDGKTVTSIASEVFKNNATLEKITIPSTVTNIGESAFENCTALKKAVIPNGVTEISEDVFRDCSSLEEVTLPDSITDIYDCAFYMCAALKSITIPDGVTYIGNGAFYKCTALKKVTIPSSVEQIDRNAFCGCTGLEEVTISEGVKQINELAFYGCTALKEVTIPASVEHIGDYAFGFYYDDGENDSVKEDGFKITCYEGTAGEQYAKDNGFDFEYIKPDKITGLTFGARSADYVSLKWNKGTNADGYIIEYLSGNKFVKLTDKTNGNAVSFKATELNAGTLYKFRVRGYMNVNGKRVYGEYSDVLNVRTLPNAMTGLMLGARTDNSITLKWDKNETANGAVVEMYKDGAWVTVATKTNNFAVSQKITGLKTGTQYKFRVRAYINDEGGKIYSVYNVTLNEVTAPVAVTNFRSVKSAKSAIGFNWDKNTTADGYEIDMAVDGKWVNQATVEGGNSIAYAQLKLMPNTAYRFRIRAYKVVDGKKVYSSYTVAVAKTAK